MKTVIHFANMGDINTSCNRSFVEHWGDGEQWSHEPENVTCPKCKKTLHEKKQEYIPPEGGTGEIEIDLGNVKTPDIFKELKDLKRHNIVGKTMEESKTGHYVSYDDVLRLFHKYWGK